MSLNAIVTEADYTLMLEELVKLLNAQVGTKEFDRLELLANHLHAYEQEHYPMMPPDPDAIIEYATQKRG